MKRITRDKWVHFFGGIVMGAVIQAFMWKILPVQSAIIVTFLIVAAISYGFELFSKITGKGYYEVMDAVAAILGGVVGMAGMVVYEVR